MLSTRAEAVASGRNSYYNGTPCPKGHLDYRLVSGACVECDRARSRKYYAKHREMRNKAVREWAEQNPGYFRNKAKEWKKNHRARATATQMMRYAKTKTFVCSCCTRQDFDSVYDAARAIGGHVDHIEPLALGGPHCVKNLQVLTVAEHMAKTKEDRQAIAKAKRAAA